MPRVGGKGQGPSINDRERYLADRDRQRQALRMWGRKMSTAEIARQLGCSVFTAHHLIKRGLGNLDVQAALERQQQMNQALEEEERLTWGIVARPGYKTSPSGRIIYEPQADAEGRPVPAQDQSVRLAALAHLLRVHERQAKLNGLDQPQRIDVQVGLDAAMAAAALLEAEASRLEADDPDIIDVEETLALPRGRRVG